MGLIALTPGLLVLGSCRRNPGSPVHSARAELIEALGACRPLEGRLCRGFEYALIGAGVPRPVGGAAERQRLAVRRILGRTGEDWQGRRESDLALVRVLGGRLQEAAAGLEAALPWAPSGGRLASDLAAVELALLARSHDLHHAWLALRAAEEAVRDDPALTEAWFNRALALEAMGIDWEARTAWRTYLDRDPASGWAREARTHLGALLARQHGGAPWEEQRASLEGAALAGEAERVREIVASHRQAARELAEQELLGTWGASFLHGEPAAARRALALARAVGAALLRLRGDAMTADAVAVIDAAAGSGDVGRLAALAAGHDAYRQAAVANLDLGRSLPLLARAQRLLTAGGSPFAAWPSLQAAIGDYQRSRYREALAVLERVSRDQGDRYPCLRAKALRLMGLTYGVLADYSRARASLFSCARLYEDQGETSNQVSALALLATSQQYMGEGEEAWRTRCLALRRARNLASLPNVLLGETALDAYSQGQPAIALYFQNEGLRLAELASQPATLAYGLRTRAAIYHRLGQTALADSDLARALVLAEQIQSGSPRSSLRGDILAIAAENLRRRDPRGAARLFRQVLRTYRGTRYHHYLAQLHQKCAGAYLAVGDLDAAEGEYREAIGEREQQRTILPEEQQRTAFFDDVEPVFEEMSAFQLVHRARSDLAFAYFEQARARTLLDLITRSKPREATDSASVRLPAQPLDAAAIRKAMPADTAIIAYSVEERYTLAWVLRRNSLQGASLPLRADRLARTVEALRQEVSGERAPASRGGTAAVLFHELVAPLIETLPRGSRIVFIPDKCLNLVSFAGLYDSLAGRYLIEDHPLSVAPSATVFVRSLGEDARRERQRPAQLLIVDAANAPAMATLPGARAEAAAIEQLYGRNASLLSGGSATPGAVLASMGDHDIVHFASHALIDPRVPERSKLVLAADASARRSGELLIGDLFGLPLRRTRLIVLAGCGTGTGRISNTEGALSLARPFLADGVPAVVAALWNVDDQAAARMLIDFHRRLRGGEDAVAALRGAQLGLLRGSDPYLQRPACWAAFELFGGVQQAARINRVAAGPKRGF